MYSNTTAAPHDGDPAAIVHQLAEHLVSPVRFADEIEAMYAAGARVFVEVGPQAVLTGLAGQILAGKPHVAVASDLKSRPGLVQLAHLLGQLLVGGRPCKPRPTVRGRGVRAFDLAKLGPDTGKPTPPRPRGWSTASAAGRSTAPNRDCSAKHCRSIGTRISPIDLQGVPGSMGWEIRLHKNYPHSLPFPSPRRVSLPRPPFPLLRERR